MTIQIVTREQWGAVTPKSRYYIKVPTPELWLHHSASSGSDEVSVRAIQKYHMAEPPAGRGWSDIAYSYLMDNDAPDVDIFEGRGAGVAGGHTKGHNTVSHAICVIGNFNNDTPTAQLLEKLPELVVWGYKKGYWPLGFTGGHCNTRGPCGTGDCPGNNLYALIPTINKRARELNDGGIMAHVESDHYIFHSSGASTWSGIDELWAQFLAKGYSTVPKSRTWEVRREDLAWFRTKVLAEARAETAAAISKAIKALPPPPTSTGLTAAQVKALIAATKLTP